MRKLRTFLRRSLLIAVLGGMAAAVQAHAADSFITPTKEELEMKSLPGYPGAAAVILTMDEMDNDQLHVKQYYKRIKILTEKGKDLADVEIGFANYTSDVSWDYSSLDKDVTDIQARTIHADGTVVPFTGKPYLKTLEKNKSFKYQAKVFTLPDVQVGDIIEFRYAERIDDHWFEAPDWYIQGEYYVRSAHYIWYPTSADLTGPSGGLINSITWFPILPAGAKIENHQLPGGRSASTVGGPTQTLELSVKDVPPAPEEEYMPPTASFTYRVLFNFSEFHSVEEYWKDSGKRWSKGVNGFSDPDGAVHTAATQLTAGASTSEEKLRRLYDAVQQMENSDYTREHSQQEDKAVGLGKVSHASDVLTRKRGSSLELSELFLSLARAAGFKAYAMLVPDRAHRIFVAGWLNMRQFDGQIVIVNVDGKEMFLDPGERYCSFGHLAWQHTFVGGIRQTDGGTAFAQTPGDGYKANSTQRIANLTMEDTDAVSGKIDFTFMGSPALEWRQRALSGDDESLRHSLRTSLERMLPRSMEVKVGEISNLTDYEKPLHVSYTVKGTMATPTGKRLLLPVDLFESNEVASFPHEKREMNVYFHYPQIVQDALRIHFPASFKVEATPEPAKSLFENEAAYDLHTETAPDNVTTRRTFIFGEINVPVKEYSALRTFYSQFQTGDRNQIILQVAAVAPTMTAGKKGGMN